ncbi:MAG: SusC/RagA family TonB-linked outer membrane protein [Bacteroidia bacterium]|nr:SusC/RagA family TonB-linked outer membrane protein [Bacteroidia bacterium]
MKRKDKRNSLREGVFSLIFLLSTLLLSAQNVTVRGTVTDETGETVIGATVIVEGNAAQGTTTDYDGNYVLNNVPANGNLVFSYVGMESQIVPVNGRATINVTMASDTELLQEVVVTALGIQRQSKTLTYAAETVGGDKVADVKSVNVINSLQGKSAGLVITPNSTGAGGASKILLRGNKSINGNNQPLIVVDGVPLMNTTNGQVSSNWGGERDGGDAMSTINPDDIASISILKGASAAALYGAVAANGAIMITTKSAQSGKARIQFSSNTTIETPMVLPKFQTTYGASADNLTSWGSKLSTPSKNYVKDYFQMGYTLNNSISISGGSDVMQGYLSYGNITSTGITPKNDFKSHTFNSKVAFNLFNKALEVDFSARYVTQDVKNGAASGFLFNPLTGAYLFARGADWDGYKNEFEKWDITRNINTQNLINIQEQYQNPYWMVNRMVPHSKRDRFEFGGGAKWNILENLNIAARLKYERSEERFVNNLYASSFRYPMGRMKDERYWGHQYYGDLLLNYNTNLTDDITLATTVGTSFTDYRAENVGLWAEGEQAKIADGKVTGNIWFPNVFIPTNFYSNMASQGYSHKRLNSVFGTAQIGLFEKAYIDVTARNDWSSALAYTPNISFFYPSIGGNILLNELMNMGDNVNLLKLRASYSIVGNDIPVYLTNLRYTLKGGGVIEAPSSAPFKDLKPEKTHSKEIGIDGTFFRNRMNVNLTLYRTNTINQFFSIASPYPTGLRNRYINAGDVQNQGVEATVSYITEFTPDFNWATNLNFSYNDNKIIKLTDELKDGASLAGYGGAQMKLVEGGSYGDLYVKYLEKDDKGALKLNKDGLPIVSGQDDFMIGNLNAKIHLGWSNTFNYKDVTLSFLIDGKIGGKALSMTEATLDGWGVSERSGKARDEGGVVVNGTKVDAQAYYETVGAKNFNTNYPAAEYVYNATNFRMREISLGYTFRKLINNSSDLSLSLIGRNLFFIYKDAPMDPDVSASINNGWQGVDIFALPTTRSFGLNVKINF